MRLLYAGALISLLCLLGSGGAFAKDAPPAHAARSYVGVQALALTGVHRDIAGDQYGIAGGALLQFSLTGERIGIHAEGIPVIGSPQQRASAYYGAATPALGIFNGTVRVAIDRRSRFWIGLGTTVINQRTPLPNISQVAYSRLAGGRYELFVQIPTRGAYFIESSLGGAPSLRGADHYLYSDGSAPVNKDELASEEDLSLA
ncbi:MAG: hypothetical protein ABI182_05175, partial [Candidatus Baltobacteraceae bacterium]